MTANLPDWTAFDPASDNLPSPLSGDGSAAPSVGLLTLCVDPSVEGEWAARAAMAIARGMVASGRNVFLADLGLDEPTLHEAIGIENGEGVSDVFQFGASVRRVARPVSNGGYLVATAGTPAADPAAVLGHARWDNVLSGFRDAGALMVALVPSDAAGVDAIVGRSDAVVVLGGAGSSAPAGALSVAALIGPAGAAPAEPVIEAPGEPVVDSVAEPPVETGSDVEESAPAAAMEAAVEEESGAFDLAGFDDAPAAESEATSGGDDLFSVDGLEGDQYGSDTPDDPSMELSFTETPMTFDETPEPEAPEPVEAAPDDGFDFGDGGLEVEAPVEAEAEAPPVAEEPVVPDAEPEEPGIPAMEVEGSMLVEDEGADDLAAGGTMMEGLETGAGFEMPDDEAADDTPTGSFDMGDGPLEVEAPEPEAEEAPDSLEVEDGALEVETTALNDDEGADIGSVDGGAMEVLSAEDEFMQAAPDPTEEEAPFVDPGAAAASEPEAAPAEETPAAAESEEPKRLSGLEKLERQQKAQAARKRLVTILASVLILGGAGFGVIWMGIVPIEGITPQSRIRSSVPPPIELAGATPTTPTMTHTLLTEDYRDLVTALQFANQLDDIVENAVFYVAPVQVDDRRLWGLFAGPAYSAVEADAMRAPVNAAFQDRFDSTQWQVLDAVYAFFFGEFDTLPEAELRRDGLIGREIPSYVLQVDYPDGSVGFRVYGGGYADEFQAVPFGEILREAEMTDIPLTTRRGKLPE